MESSCSLTKLEMDAVLQLIQLSGSSGDDLRVLWVDFAVDGGGGGAVETSSSMSSTASVNEDVELLPRTNHRFGSLIEIYSKTAPSLMKNRAKKARF